VVDDTHRGMVAPPAFFTVTNRPAYVAVAVTGRRTPTSHRGRSASSAGDVTAARRSRPPATAPRHSLPAR
jgi:hypothetical protein